MRIEGRPLPTLLQLRAGAPGLALEAGQRLRATVVSVAKDRVLLELAGNRVETRTELALRPGQQLDLRVAATEPTITLRVVAPSSDRESLTAAMRNLLPQSGSLESAAPRILELLRAPRESLPAELRSALDALAKILPSAHALQDADALRQALARAGLTRENALATEVLGGTRAPADLKTALERVAARLRAALPDADGRQATRLLQLLSHGEAALNRLGLVQLNAADPQAPLDLLFEFPVWHDGRPEPLRLRIEEEPEPAHEDAAQQPRSFKVRLAFDFPDLGLVQANLQLRGERIDVAWWAEHADAVARLNRHLERLDARLRTLGLEVVQTEARLGRPEGIGELPRLRQGLLHEKA